MKIIRKYAPIVFLLMGSVFMFSFAVDEYADYKSVQRDMCVEASVEFDVEDLEWDEGDDADDWHFVCNMAASDIQYINNFEPAISSDIHRSSEQWRGLVRKYSPGKSTFFVVLVYAV